ncbi:MAG TPA: ATP-binding cassette domain-containing protein [Azospira sp.]|nr:ATP-binding cassette domain-containing protein [Azospira sp.]
MILIEACALSAGYRRPAFAPLSFALARGGVLGVRGANGCGKSTLLAALLGQARIFAGEVRRAPGLRASLQTQRQPPLAGVPLCGAELLALTGATADGLPGGLADCLDQRLDRLSGGQRQFLQLWACLQAPADLVLLDEPTNNLDAAGVAQLGGAVRARAAAGLGVIVVSHDADFLAAACDRVLRMGGSDAVA